MTALRTSLGALALFAWTEALAEPSPAEVVEMVRVVDERQANNGDVTASIFMEHKEKGKSDLVYQAMVYRRDASEKLVILFTRPEAEAGKGYLRVDKNLFFYDPAVGNWSRHTERDRIVGTDSRRQDFDRTHFAELYEVRWMDEATLGNFQTHHLELVARDGSDVAFPRTELWIDKDSGNMLKRQDFALSGRLVRTSYYPKWQRVYSDSKGDHVYLPVEIRIFDELQEGKQTAVLVQEVDLKTLDDNIFTKAWLESKSR